MLVVLKFNKCGTFKQKITNPLTNERHMLVSSYFYTHFSCLLNFNTDDAISFEIQYFFLTNYLRTYTKFALKLAHQFGTSGTIHLCMCFVILPKKKIRDGFRLTQLVKSLIVE